MLWYNITINICSVFIRELLAFPGPLNFTMMNNYKSSESINFLLPFVPDTAKDYGQSFSGDRHFSDELYLCWVMKNVQAVGRWKSSL
jgi:hypothetical protein